MNANPISAPPTADPTTAAIDLFYSLANRGSDSAIPGNA